MTPGPLRTVTLKCEACQTHRTVRTRLVHREPKRRCVVCRQRMKVIASTVLTSAEAEA